MEIKTSLSRSYEFMAIDIVILILVALDMKLLSLRFHYCCFHSVTCYWRQGLEMKLVDLLEFIT